jgi:16S rRNA (cytosine967-C5)-methyltransferase
VATDLKEFKLTELKKRAKRAGIANIRTFVWDGEAPLRLPKEIARQKGFDKVLVDAPCTATGTWRRNPDARNRLNDDYLNELTALQQQLLNHASDAVRSGGKLIYATCSWLAEENEDAVETFLKNRPEFSLETSHMLGAPDVDSDTMFVAIMKRES